MAQQGYQQLYPQGEVLGKGPESSALLPGRQLIEKLESQDEPEDTGDVPHQIPASQVKIEESPGQEKPRQARTGRKGQGKEPVGG